MIDIHTASGLSIRQSTNHKNASFELTQTVVRHGGEQAVYGPGVDSTQLSLSAKLPDEVRGTVHRPMVFHHRLALDGWELTGPKELPEAWAHQARHALAQMHLCRAPGLDNLSARIGLVTGSSLPELLGRHLPRGRRADHLDGVHAAAGDPVEARAASL